MWLSAILPGCFRHTVRQDDKHHQTGKPTPLMRDLVKLCPPGGVIFDGYAGSGTTAVAAILEGRRVIAVGTTSLRALESAARGAALQPCSGETDIFITPGYRFRVVQGLLTNFHLPRSTLLALVMAFTGEETTRRAYREDTERAAHAWAARVCPGAEVESSARRSAGGVSNIQSA